MDLREFISKCEAAGKLKRVKKEVDWNLELSHISKINEEKDGGALLFENVKGYRNAVLTGAYSTKENFAIALGLPLGTSMCEMSRHWMQLAIKELIPPVEVKDGPILENLIERKDVNLFDFPVPQMYRQDGGRFIGTAATLVTRDPESGWVNLGTYRMQILDEKSAGIQISRASMPTL